MDCNDPKTRKYMHGKYVRIDVTDNTVEFYCMACNELVYKFDKTTKEYTWYLDPFTSLAR